MQPTKPTLEKNPPTETQKYAIWKLNNAQNYSE